MGEAGRYPRRQSFDTKDSCRGQVRTHVEKLSGLMRGVRRALLMRTIVGATLSAALVLGALGLVVALAFPSLPRWPFLAALGLAPIVGAILAIRRMP